MQNLQRHTLLGQHIREMRLAAGMTQITLAGALGKPQSYVAKIEAGERRLDVFEFIDIVQAIGGNLHEEIERLRKRLP